MFTKSLDLHGGRIYTPQKKFCTTWTMFTFSPKFCKLLGKLLMFIDISVKWWLLIKIVIKHSSFYFSSCYNRGIESMRVTEHLLQKSQLLKFYLLFVRVYRGEKLKLLKFSSNFYEISHNDSKDFIRTNNYGYFEFLGKNVVFEQKISSSNKTTGLSHKQ